MIAIILLVLGLAVECQEEKIRAISITGRDRGSSNFNVLNSVYEYAEREENNRPVYKRHWDSIDGSDTIYLFSIADLDRFGIYTTADSHWIIGTELDTYSYFAYVEDEATHPLEITEVWKVYDSDTDTDRADYGITIDEFKDGLCDMRLSFPDSNPPVSNLAGIDILYKRGGFWNGNPLYEGESETGPVTMYNFGGYWIISQSLTRLSEDDVFNELVDDGYLVTDEHSPALTPDLITEDWADVEEWLIGFDPYTIDNEDIVIKKSCPSDALAAKYIIIIVVIPVVIIIAVTIIICVVWRSRVRQQKPEQVNYDTEVAVEASAVRTRATGGAAGMQQNYPPGYQGNQEKVCDLPPPNPYPAPNPYVPNPYAPNPYPTPNPTPNPYAPNPHPAEGQYPQLQGGQPQMYRNTAPQQIPPLQAPPQSVPPPQYTPPPQPATPEGQLPGSSQQPPLMPHAPKYQQGGYAPVSSHQDAF